ncbi:MAG: hypothetical protein IKE31_05455 [Eubacterium sp.]|nr:hypothetical protein [Eubacterium sp.]
MFDNYVLSEGTVKNETGADGKVTGFSMKTRVNYYRGIPLSMVHDLEVELDGEKMDRSKVKLTVDGIDYFTADEMETVTAYKWEFGEEATVIVEKEGGLPAGEHDVMLSQTIRTEYIPVPFIGHRTEHVTI